MIRFLILLVSVYYTAQAMAFPCYLTMVKDSCWGNYNVTIDVFDAANNKQITTVIIPEGSSWARQKFTCQLGEKLRFQAQFTPVFWQSDMGKVYPAKNFWTLPSEVTKGDTAWNINLCYPAEFAEVPIPPSAGNQCKCDTSGIPPIQP